MNNSRHKIAKDAGVIGLGTLLSRILGFARDMVLAGIFGVYSLAQAFVIAFKIPNLLRDFIGEGASNSAVVPVLSEYREKHAPKEFWELVNIVLAALACVAVLLTALGIVCSPLIVRLIAPGFGADPVKLADTILLNRIIFPYLIFIVLSAFVMGVLNTLKHFSVPAFAPCLLNISIIICAMAFGEGIRGLSLGVLIGGLLQLAIQLPVLFKYGFRFRIPRRLDHPAARLIGRLMLPRFLSTAIYQLNNFVDSIFGSLSAVVGEGGVAVLYFSYRLILFPLGLFSTSLSQALLPRFSVQALAQGGEELKATLSWGLRATFLVMLPASALFMGLSGPIIACVFQRGRFDSYSAWVTAQALYFYSIGLSAYAANKIVQGCFFALKDTVAPTKAAGLSLGLNILLNTVLMFPFKIGGIALATSLSGIISLLALMRMLYLKIGDFGLRQLASSFLRILAASVAAGLTAYFCSQLPANKYFNLTFGLIGGGLAYLGFCVLFRVQEIRELWGWISSKR
jgi:putative peptidoglycan lipid II flippase